jgi:hypothetical protein
LIGSILISEVSEPRKGEIMKARGYAELTTTELPDGLQFVVVRRFGWADVIGPIYDVLFVICFLWFALSNLDRWKPLTLTFVLVSLFFFLHLHLSRWLHGRTTTLRVTADGLHATGNLGNLFATSLEATASEVASIRYQASPEWTTGGVYLKRGKASVRILPGLRFGPGNEVIDTIFRRFPHLKPIDNSPAARLFGRQAGATAPEGSNPPRMA